MSGQKRGVANTPLTQKSMLMSTSQLPTFVGERIDDTVETDDRQVSFRSRGLTSDDVQSISIFFEQISELDLSDNRIELIPRGIPSNLAAMNLSKNLFKSLVGFDQLTGLCMLRLHHNSIERTWGLQACIKLEHLDLSNNRITVLEGLETLTCLKTLILSNNNIKKMGAIRSLSFNTQLQELRLNHNPITTLPKYRGAVKHLVPSLIQLDGSSVFFSEGNRGTGYEQRHRGRQHANAIQGAQTLQLGSHEHAPSVGEGGSVWNEVYHRWNIQDGLVPSPPKHFVRHGGAAGTESVLSAVTVAPEGNPADLPWNRCPHPIPKDRQGREMYEAPPASPPVRSPVTSHRALLRAKQRETKRTAAGTQSAGKKGPVDATPSTGKSKNFSLNSGGFTVKSARTPRTPGGLSAKVKEANIQYPIWQPLCSPPRGGRKVEEPPPPPPPPSNRYKITLGKQAPVVSTKSTLVTPQGSAGSPKPIRGHTHAPRHDIIRVHTMDADWYSDDGDMLSEISPGRRQAVVTGVPIMAEEVLRRAVSPPKVTPALHRSLTVEYPADDEEGTRKVLHHYNSHINDSGGSLMPPQWSPPPLPFERSVRSQRYDNSAEDEEEEYADRSRDKSPGHRATADRRSNRSGYADEEDLTDATFDSYAEDTYDMDDLGSVSAALRHIYDQKKRTVQNIREKRLASKDRQNDTTHILRSIPTRPIH